MGAAGSEHEFRDSVLGVPPLPVIPSPAAPDSLRIATKEDIDNAKTDIRREMRLWLSLGVVGGNVVATTLLAVVKPDTAQHALARVIGLF